MSYRIDVALGTFEDSVMVLYGADGVKLADNDDYGDSRASQVVWNAPTSGSYYIEAGSYSTDVGTYTPTVLYCAACWLCTPEGKENSRSDAANITPRRRGKWLW